MAKRFQFRLQTLLDVRKMREQEAQRAVAAKRAEIVRVDQLNEQTFAEIAIHQDALRTAQAQGAIDPVGLARGRAWIAHLRNSIARRQQEKGVLLEQLRELQDRLRDARTQTRIIEKLREKRWDAYRKDRDKRERLELDELAQQLQGYDAV